MSSIRWLRATAVVFAVSYVGAMFTASLPEGAYDDRRVVGLLSGGQLTGIVFGGHALVVAGLSALVFTSLLAGVLSGAGHGDGPGLVRALGSGYALMVLLAAVLFLAVPMGHVVGELPEATPSPFRELTMAGFTALLVPALICASALVGVVSALVRRSELAPRWSTTTGFVIAPLLLLGAGWAPQFLVPLWALLVAFTVQIPAPPYRAPGQLRQRVGEGLVDVDAGLGGGRGRPLSGRNQPTG